MSSNSALLSSAKLLVHITSVIAVSLLLLLFLLLLLVVYILSLLLPTAKSSLEVTSSKAL
jgi:hypothetical protein